MKMALVYLLGIKKSLRGFFDDSELRREQIIHKHKNLMLSLEYE